MKTHTGEKLNKCNQCDFASSRASNLRTHMKTHSGENSNKCNQCGYASSHAGHLRTHLKTHSGEKPNKCNQCDFVSSQAGNLKKHMKTHSGESQTNATNVTLHLLGHTCYTKIPKNTGIYFQKSRYLYLSPIPVYQYL